MDIPFEVDIKLLPRRRPHIPEELLVADERDQRIADLERDLATAQADLSDTIDAEIREQARLINEHDVAQAWVAALTQALLGVARIVKSQMGEPCWCDTIAGLYCVGQPQCEAAQKALNAAREKP